MYSEPCPDHCTEGYTTGKEHIEEAVLTAIPWLRYWGNIQLWKRKVREETELIVGIAQWLEHWTHDWTSVSSNPCRSSGRVFFSMVNFVCWLLFQCLFHPRVTAVARKRSRSFCQKCRWQVTAKHAYTLHMWLCTKWHGAWLYGIHRTHWDISRFMWRQPFQCWSTALQWIFKNAL